MAIVFQLNGSFSSSSLEQTLLLACQSTAPNSVVTLTQMNKGNGFDEVSCFDSGFHWLTGISNPVITARDDTPGETCGVITASDGVMLGWSVGTALIVTAAVLFIRKALL